MAEPDNGDVTAGDLDKLKLRFIEWLSDKDDFVHWMRSVTAVVRSIRHGDELEDWLDVKLDRSTFQPMMVSAVITEDPDFAMPAQVDGIGDPLPPETVTRTLFDSPRTVRSVQSLRATNQTAALPSAGSYYSLSTGARHLDRMLYSILRGLIKGSKAVLLDCTHIQSYVQGMCIIFKHCDINRNDRISRAFDGVDGLKYGGDAQMWATSCILKVRELFASKASISHYALTRIMHSLDGKLKSVQYKIAEDLNALRPEDDVNIYDLIQTYATMIASVGDTGKVLAVEDDHCHYCDELGHHLNDCPKRAADITSGKLVPGRGKGKGGGRRNK